MELVGAQGKAGTSSQQIPQAADGTNPSCNKNRNLGKVSLLPLVFCSQRVIRRMNPEARKTGFPKSH